MTYGYTMITMGTLQHLDGKIRQDHLYMVDLPCLIARGYYSNRHQVFFNNFYISLCNRRVMLRYFFPSRCVFPESKAHRGSLDTLASLCIIMHHYASLAFVMGDPNRLICGYTVNPVTMDLRCPRPAHPWILEFPGKQTGFTTSP